MGVSLAASACFDVAAVALDVLFTALPDGRQGNVSQIKQTNAEPTFKPCVSLFYVLVQQLGTVPGRTWGLPVELLGVACLPFALTLTLAVPTYP